MISVLWYNDPQYEPIISIIFFFFLITLQMCSILSLTITSNKYENKDHYLYSEALNDKNKYYNFHN